MTNVSQTEASLQYASYISVLSNSTSNNKKNITKFLKLKYSFNYRKMQKLMLTLRFTDQSLVSFINTIFKPNKQRIFGVNIATNLPRTIKLYSISQKKF